MQPSRGINAIVGSGIFSIAVSCGVGAGGHHEAPEWLKRTPTAISERKFEAPNRPDHVMVPPPPLSEDTYPCSECHDDPKEVNTKRRKLTEEHEKIKLNHGPREGWCFECHHPLDRDKLRLASGRKVSFKKSYLLCGQCHGPKLRDWRAGIHGKRTGSWRDKKQYRLCVHCHVPHSPRFEPIKPKPPPVRPSQIKYSPGRKATTR